MAYTLGEIIYRVAVEVGIVEEGVTTTTGSSTVQYDTFRAEAPDYWKNGVIWSLVPASIFTCARITQFDPGNGAITHGSGISAITAGGRYAIARSPVSKSSLMDMLFQKVNQTLLGLGEVPLTDTSTVVAANQSEYSLPVTGMSRGLRQVYIQTNDDSNDNEWSPLSNWSIQPATSHTATDMVLVVPAGLPSGYNLRLDYVGIHSNLDDAADTLSEFVPLNRVVYPSALKMLEWFKMQTKRNDWDDMIQLWLRRVDEVKLETPIVHTPRRSRLLILDNGPRDGYPGSRSGY